MDLDFTDDFELQAKAFFLLELSWVFLFFFVNKAIKFPQLDTEYKANDTKNRLISIVHGLLLLVLSAYEAYREDYSESKNTRFQSFLFLISLSYFLYDTIACYWYKLLDQDTLIHHLMVIIVYLVCLQSKYGGYYTCLALTVAKLSNYPMHLRIILRHFNLRYTKIYDLVEASYFGNFSSINTQLSILLVEEYWLNGCFIIP